MTLLKYSLTKNESNVNKIICAPTFIQLNIIEILFTLL